VWDETLSAFFKCTCSHALKRTVTTADSGLKKKQPPIGLLPSENQLVVIVINMQPCVAWLIASRGAVHRVLAWRLFINVCCLKRLAAPMTLIVTVDYIENYFASNTNEQSSTQYETKKKSKRTYIVRSSSHYANMLTFV